jgi:hypothetical protein
VVLDPRWHLVLILEAAADLRGVGPKTFWALGGS